MEFKEDIAKGIIEKYGLSEQTIKVWKTRGKIPDKYADPEYAPLRKVEDLKGKRELERIKEILSSPKLNNTEIARLSGIEMERFKDWKAGRTFIPPEGLIELKKIINRLRIDGARALNDLTRQPPDFSVQVKNYLNREEILLFPLLKGQKIHYERISRGRQIIPYDTTIHVRDCLSIFLLELNIA
jgi:hypothetical protein